MHRRLDIQQLGLHPLLSTPLAQLILSIMADPKHPTVPSAPHAILPGYYNIQTYTSKQYLAADNSGSPLHNKKIFTLPGGTRAGIVRDRSPLAF